MSDKDLITDPEGLLIDKIIDEVISIFALQVEVEKNQSTRLIKVSSGFNPLENGGTQILHGACYAATISNEIKDHLSYLERTWHLTYKLDVGAFPPRANPKRPTNSEINIDNAMRLHNASWAGSFVTYMCMQRVNRSGPQEVSF